jgi:uncharacterized protein YhbP (UPF0306 family)
MVEMAAPDRTDLIVRVGEYLRAHHVMCVATADPSGNTPHAANVFYAVDSEMRLIFVSRPTSLHGLHMGKKGPVAVTVSEDYDDWRLIQGVQLWGTAERLGPVAKVAALARYFKQFPFARELMRDSPQAVGQRDIAVYRVSPERVSFTDNTSGLFGRETLELVRE